ncbi:hypothetical protein [Streptomyces sp. GESEQ-35]|uniref:hypothetical protein n=1 Tax=Streptomyces sp. GESEQ-35 TaxID=2812657 RepID=UPI001B319172|nr:hypothetical protein [Streptomyces sp. GESEQ-35]
MSARRTTRSPDRLLLTATALVATAVMLRLLSPDSQADAGTEPSPTRSGSTQHKKPGPPVPRPTTWTSHNPQQPPADLPGS